MMEWDLRGYSSPGMRVVVLTDIFYSLEELCNSLNE